MPALGSGQMRAVARDLRAEPPRLRRRFAANLRAAAEPIKTEAQANFRGMPNHSGRSTGLGAALAAATRVSVAQGARNVAVRIITDGRRMPAGKQGLPQMVEGEVRWRHPVFGNRKVWVGEAPHPSVGPAVAHHLSGVIGSVERTIDQTAADLARG